MLNGKWTVSTSMGIVNLTLNLKSSGNNLTGSVSYQNKSAKITNGKIRDKSFSFESLIRTKHGDIKAFVQGYLIDATHMAGIVKASLGSLRFTAVKN